MAQVATPTFTANGGKVAPADTFTLACGTAGATIYYTFGDTEPSDTNWTEYTVAVALPSESGTTTTVRAYAIKTGDDDSEVASATFYTVGYSEAVSATAKTVLDTAASQGLGAATQGFATTAADGASISGWRIGASGTTTDLKAETN